jgi:AraC-like DNA-binding protein
MVLLRPATGQVNGVTADASSLLLVPPDIEYVSQQEAGWEYGVDTEPEHLQALLPSRVRPDGVVAVSSDPQLNLQLREMIGSELSGDKVEGGILAHALAPFDVAPEKFISRAREVMARRIRDAIDARLDHSICLSDVCRDIGVSVRTAERAFKLRFQETMIGYIKRARLERARQMLTTGVPVTEAALEVGWTHLGRFSVEFKKRFGESPSRYRARQLFLA